MGQSDSKQNTSTKYLGCCDLRTADGPQKGTMLVKPRRPEPDVHKKMNPAPMATPMKNVTFGSREIMTMQPVDGDRVFMPNGMPPSFEARQVDMCGKDAQIDRMCEVCTKRYYR
jgi:hypothetical protein